MINIDLPWINHGPQILYGCFPICRVQYTDIFSLYFDCWCDILLAKLFFLSLLLVINLGQHAHSYVSGL